MVKLLSLGLKSIIELYNASQHMYICISHTSHVCFSHSSPTVSHSETISHLSHMWLRTLYLTFYGYLGHDMVKLSCLLLKSIVEPYTRRITCICVCTTHLTFLFHASHKFPYIISVRNHIISPTYVS